MARKRDVQGGQQSGSPSQAAHPRQKAATKTASTALKPASKGRSTAVSDNAVNKVSSPRARTAKTGKDAAAPGVVKKATTRKPAVKKAPQKAPSAPSAAELSAPVVTHTTDTSARKVPNTPDTAPDETVAQMMEVMTAPALTARMAENIERIEILGQRLARALAQRPLHPAGVEGPGPELAETAANAWVRLASEQPTRIIEQQLTYWADTMRHVAQAQQAFALRGFSAPQDDGADGDRRFANPLWRTNPFFSFVRRQYQINADALRRATAELDIPGNVERRRIDWFTRQIIDMMSPTNFLATNPDALEKAIATEGESLVRGLENLVADVEANGGELVVSLADRSAFSVGRNIGTTPGEVVHRTPLFELIQFTPSTEQVHRTPLLVFPPWINKYYIMDLKPQNSLLRWIVDQGFTLFVVSWKNPDARFANTGMEDYVSAYLDAVGKVLELTGEPKLNAVGYCIGGTTLALTLGLMKQRGDDRVNAATFFTTLTDFSDQGEFTTFLQDDFVGGIEDEVTRVGYLSSQLMQRTFSFLRANDLVWGPAIRSYMLGEAPPAFDLLFWNGDGTNLPGRMVTEYLRLLCQQNALAGQGFDVLGHTVRLSDVTVPLCAIACETDHIAPWAHSWRGVAQMGSADRTFILSESGHIAGIINPPSKKKYGHYTSDGAFTGDPQGWLSAAQFTEGSWWPRWSEWLSALSSEMVSARDPVPALGPAPGSYVHESA